MKTNKKGIAKKIVIGGVSGVVLGASTMATAGDDVIDALSEDMQESSANYEEMSFGDAFAAARGAQGPDGSFEWHGNTYSTSTAEEWEAAHPSEPLAEEGEDETDFEDETDSEDDEVEILGTEDEQDDEIEAEVETGNDINGDDAAFVEVAEQVQTDAVEDVFVGQDADSICDAPGDYVNDDAPMM